MAGVIGEMVTFPNQTADVSAFLARPEATGAFPGVIVIQEWWGLVPHIKDVASRFAAEGFVALAPDLYHGQTASEPDGAMQLSRSLAWESALHDLKATAKHFSRLPYCTGAIGSVGFCMGGGLSFRLAAHTDDLSACVIFYGMSPDQLAEAEQVNCPVLGHYGEEDARITQSMPALESALRNAGTPVEMHVYGGAPHAFFNDESPAYREWAAKEAWARTLAFFNEHLR